MGLRIALIIRPGVVEERLNELHAGVATLRAQGHEVTPRVTFESGDGRRLAMAAARTGYDLVIAAGGDGTLNEVVNGLTRAESPPRLAVVPLGTANDFAVGLRLPAEVGAAMRVAVEGEPRTVDVARVNDRYC
ncbi:MAG TPA: diacylglycerol kinase family protein, partial [Longimicrobiales bacterium]|nr:diacylglycerol kinase family protein [Longimicrobiales bacterium]